MRNLEVDACFIAVVFSNSKRDDEKRVCFFLVLNGFKKI